jgi:hypothetical protein
MYRKQKKVYFYFFYNLIRVWHVMIIIFLCTSSCKGASASEGSSSNKNNKFPPPPTDFNSSSDQYYYDDNTREQGRIRRADSSTNTNRSFPRGSTRRIQEDNQWMGKSQPQDYTHRSGDRQPENPSQDPQQQQPYDGTNAFQARTPIHYTFPEARKQLQQQQGEEDYQGFQQPMDPRRQRPSATTTEYASPRRDTVTRYISTKRGRAIVTTSSCIVGMGFGALVGKVLPIIPKKTQATKLLVPTLFGMLFVILSFTRSAYGELVKAVALSMVFLLQSTKRIRKVYPTTVHIKSILSVGPRRPFPPAQRIDADDGTSQYDDNPWAYKAIYVDDVDFRMLPSLIAMIFIGTLCGGTVPIIPTWIGALLGAALFASLTTMRNARVRLKKKPASTLR